MDPLGSVHDGNAELVLELHPNVVEPRCQSNAALSKHSGKCRDHAPPALLLTYLTTDSSQQARKSTY